MGTKGKASDGESRRQTSLLSFFRQPSGTKAGDKTTNQSSSLARQPLSYRPSSTNQSRGRERSQGKRKIQEKSSLPERSMSSRSANKVTHRINAPDVSSTCNNIDTTRDTENKRKKTCEAEDVPKEKSATENALIVDNPIEKDFAHEMKCSTEKEESDRDKDDSKSEVEVRADVLSDYELLRLRNIERNNARLASLGLLQNNPISSSAERSKAKKRHRKKKPSRSSTVPTIPTRRSTRSRRSVVSAASFMNNTDDFGNSQTTEALEDPVEEEGETFTASPLLQYTMRDYNVATDTRPLPQPETIAKTTGASGGASLSPVGPRLIPPKGLKAIYSLDFHSSHRQPSSQTWLVGAGKAGIVALWDCKYWSSPASRTAPWPPTVESGIDPVLSWKAHKGKWVADARFLPSLHRAGVCASSTTAVPDHPPRLATAGNDGTVCLWDLSSVSVQSGIPKLLSQSGCDLHTNGIFAMDVDASAFLDKPVIATGSKDKTVALSVLEESSSSIRASWRSTFHSAKVAAVKLRGRNTALLASASDDGCVCIHDYKTVESNGVVAALDHAHERPHSVIWHPVEEHILMTGTTTKGMYYACSL